jgi:hypothetical protein
MQSSCIITEQISRTIWVNPSISSYDGLARNQTRNKELDNVDVIATDTEVGTKRIIEKMQ